ncbi:GNAT family N-acetyltransferase [Marinomonas ostreistagni]|uniref:GNAT family N-acetyltransferase n=1 Tax=Marinomonas ostreistagni TaxID=359209 RepID=A0ABS0ZBC6_9GAMM|nr:GNAT family N-acetyltransferase [Marinomonas ostreistagni]MBJ7550961.1 GNAT family N-acetyltransferase [Marinomonas ostreistagni]
MKIRTLQLSDVEVASGVCIAAFDQSVASSLPAEGIETFAKISAPEAFRERMSKDTMMLVAEIETNIVGFAELREGNHVSMLFVRPDRQQQGIGKALLTQLIKHARSPSISVSASLSSVTAYQTFGFILSGEINQIAGLIYQPMTMTLPNE